MNDSTPSSDVRPFWRKRWLPGAAVLVLLLLCLGLVGYSARQPALALPLPQPQAVGQATEPQGESPVMGTPPSPAAPRLAQFGEEPVSADVRLIANWALHSGDHGQLGLVVVDKKEAKVYVLDRNGVLQGATPALLGSAVGDHTVPGVGDKPVAQVLPAERTTPAGRFVAEPGLNAQGEDVVWVDYDAAVSMHRVRPHVKAERRLERLASLTAADNRISFGCINLPVAFYDNVLSPMVRGSGAVVYVLPETQPATGLFGALAVSGAGRPAVP